MADSIFSYHQNSERRLMDESFDRTPKGLVSACSSQFHAEDNRLILLKEMALNPYLLLLSILLIEQWYLK